MDGAESQGLEVTWVRALAVLWCLLWRLVFLAGVFAALVASVVGLLFAFVLGPSIAWVAAPTVFALLVAALAVPIMRSVLTNRFGDFSIRLISEDRGAPAP